MSVSSADAANANWRISWNWFSIGENQVNDLTIFATTLSLLVLMLGVYIGTGCRRKPSTMVLINDTSDTEVDNSRARLVFKEPRIV